MRSKDLLNSRSFCNVLVVPPYTIRFRSRSSSKFTLMERSASISTSGFWSSPVLGTSPKQQTPRWWSISSWGRPNCNSACCNCSSFSVKAFSRCSSFRKALMPWQLPNNKTGTGERIIGFWPTKIKNSMSMGLTTCFLLSAPTRPPLFQMIRDCVKTSSIVWMNLMMQHFASPFT